MAKKTITITLYISELTYDIYNKTYLVGRSLDDGTKYKEVANMQANGDEENINQIMRSIGNAFTNLKAKLSEYIEENGTTSDNRLFAEASDLTISLKVPSNFNQATNDTIGTILHQYIVNSAIGDWFMVTNKNDAKSYADLSASNLVELRKVINKRVRPERPII